MGTKKKEQSFEEAYQALETVVQRLEAGELPLDEAIKAFEEGMALVEVCSQKLGDAETRLHNLVKRENGGFQLELAE